MKKRLGSTCLSAALLAAGLATTTVPAAADQPIVGCTPEARTVQTPTGTQYEFERCGVPDFDQRRDGDEFSGGLPAGGAMYCGPTSATNWLIYLAERGASSVRPGPGLAEDYLTMSGTIRDLGALMGTDPVEGTSSGELAAGLTTWFDRSYAGRGGDYFVVHSDYGDPERIDGIRHDFRPLGRDLAAQSIFGSLVIAGIGWYEAAPIGADHGFVRDGGHFVTVASARPYGGGSYLLGIHDPGSDEGEVTHGRRRQSNWTTDLVEARPTVLSVGPDPANGMDEKRVDHLSRLQGYGNGYLEGAVYIEPKFGLFPDPAEGRMVLQRAVTLDEGPPRTATTALDGRVIDIALDPRGISHAELDADGDIRMVNDVDGTSTTTASVPNATHIVVDDQLRTVAIDADGHITAFDRHGNPAWALLLPGATGLAFSPRADALVTLDAATGELLTLTDDGDGGEPQVRRLPAIPGNPVSPSVSLSVDPISGVVGLLEPGTNRLTRVAISENRFVTVDELALGDGAPLEGLVADATGAWYSTRGGVVVAFDEDGIELPGNPFAGQPSAPMFELLQPIDVGEAPEGPNVLPEDAPSDGDRLVVTQERSVEEVGEEHAVTVELTLDDGSPAVDRQLAYQRDGAHPGSGTLRTDGDGRATISWTGATVGTDELLVWHEIEADGAPGADEAADGIAVAWGPRTTSATSATLTSSANPSRHGRDVTFSTTVGTADPAAGPPVGSVQFTDGGAPLGGPVALDADGRATLTTRSLSVGTHRIEAAYTPADGSRFTGSTAAIDQVVRCAPLDLLCLVRTLLGGPR